MSGGRCGARHPGAAVGRGSGPRDWGGSRGRRVETQRWLVPRVTTGGRGRGGRAGPKTRSFESSECDLEPGERNLELEGAKASLGPKSTPARQARKTKGQAAPGPGSLAGRCAGLQPPGCSGARRRGSPCGRAAFSFGCFLRGSCFTSSLPPLAETATALLLCPLKRPFRGRGPAHSLRCARAAARRAPPAHVFVTGFRATMAARQSRGRLQPGLQEPFGQTSQRDP